MTTVSTVISGVLPPRERTRSLPPASGGSTGEAGDGGPRRQRCAAETPPFVPSGHFPPARGEESAGRYTFARAAAAARIIWIWPRSSSSRAEANEAGSKVAAKVRL